MNWILIALLLIALLLLAKAKARWDKERAFPYEAVQALFTPAERSFLGVLDQAVAGRCRVFGKVRIADVAAVKPSKDYRAWQRAFNRISAKHFDFVLCDNQDLSILCAIELDDRSHLSSQRQQRDVFVDTVCETIQLPLVRIPARQAYSVAEIRQILSDALDSPLDTADCIPASKPSAFLTPKESALPAKAAQPASPSCPYCDSPMIQRTSRSGRNVGKPFWGCSQYPGCRGIIAIDV